MGGVTAVASAHTPLAVAAIVLAVTTVLWKTIGLSFVPGWDAVWGHAPEAQYSRRPSDNDSAWQLFYLVMYGIFGSVAQFAGLSLSLAAPKPGTQGSKGIINSTNRYKARLLGLFHVVIGVHHGAWALTRKWGRLELSYLGLPLGGYMLAGIVAMLAAWKGAQMLFTGSDSTWSVVLRQKALADAVSLMTIIPLVGFLVCNWIGYRDAVVERGLWLVTFSAPLVMFPLDALQQQSITKSHRA